jgi:7-cyano-7-deazaguanine synthase in queuosine biosynthesis
MNMQKTKKCVVVLSGGPDSATVAYWAKKQGYDLNAITFKYGQIATKETDCAKKIAEKLGAPIKVIDLSMLKEVFGEVTSLCNLQPTHNRAVQKRDFPFCSGFIRRFHLRQQNLLRCPRVG